MANFVNRLHNYQPIPRDLVFDKSMSDRARFLYVYMASKPDGWNFVVKCMTNELGYSEDTLHKYINELIASGWLTKKEQKRDSGNRFGNVLYILNECPAVKSEEEDDDFDVVFDELDNSAQESDEPKNSVPENFRDGKTPALKEKININKEITPLPPTDKYQKLHKRYGDLSFVDDNMKDKFFEFLQYRVELGKPYKLRRCVVACYNSLVEMSCGDPKLAGKIINQTIKNEWEGLFNLKTNDNGNSKGRITKTEGTGRAEAVSNFEGETSDI